MRFYYDWVSYEILRAIKSEHLIQQNGSTNMAFDACMVTLGVFSSLDVLLYNIESLKG